MQAVLPLPLEMDEELVHGGSKQEEDGGGREGQNWEGTLLP